MFKTLISLTTIIVAIIFLTSCMKFNDEEKTDVSFTDLSKHPLYSTYDFGYTENIIDIGIQPLSVPPGIIGSLIGRDAILLEALTELGYEIRVHPFYKSSDSNYFLKRGDLELVTGGDMPAIMASAAMDVVITSLVKYGYSSIISDKFLLLSEFKHKKIGYPAISNAHFSLLEAFETSGLDLGDIELIPMQIIDMADALNRGEIDAFTSWEPNTSISLKKYNHFKVLHKSLNTSYLYFSEKFKNYNSEAVRLIIASQIRSIRWISESKVNRYQIASWTAPERLALQKDSGLITPDLINKIIERDLVWVSSSGELPSGDLKPNGRIFKEFMFLKENGTIPEDINWSKIKLSFNGAVMEEVLNKSSEYELSKFRFLEIP